MANNSARGQNYRWSSQRNAKSPDKELGNPAEHNELICTADKAIPHLFLLGELSYTDGYWEGLCSM